MKKLIASTIAVVLLGSAIIASAAAPNLVNNGDFENGMTGWTPKHIGNATAENQLGRGNA